MKKIILAAILGALLGAGGVAYAAHRHPNLAAAMSLVHKANMRIDAAQRANEFDLGGHAAKAKELLAQAEIELRQAVAASNDR
ncbi:MAG: hypothetical protein WBR15_00965 [Gammaproteobacteria bacterium]